MDWGGEKDEAWVVSDACPSQLAPSHWPAAAELVAGGGAAGGLQAFVGAGEDVLRSAAHAATSSDAWAGGYSAAAVWWAGQLAAHSLASFGRCGVLAAQKLQRTGGPGAGSGTGAARERKKGGGGLRVAMHIRRGDSCMRWAKARGDSSLRGGRPCFPTNMYLDAARQVWKQYGGGGGESGGGGEGGEGSGSGGGGGGTPTLHLATDSAEAAEAVAIALRAEGWAVVSLLFDRASVGGSETANAGKQVDKGTVYIEDRLKVHDPTLDQELVIGSLLAELELLSSADALIGTSSSWVTRLAFLLMVGRRGTPPPFVFLDGPFGCLNIKPCAVK